MAEKRFSVRNWLDAGAVSIERSALEAARPLDFGGVEDLPRPALEALVGAMGVQTAPELLDWLEPEELSPRLQQLLALAAEGGLPEVLAPPVPMSIPDHAIHPVAIVDHVIEEYRDHLVTEFRARDPQLRQKLEEAIDRPRFLAQDPFFQAHRPFLAGKPWRELGLDPRLADVMENRSRSKTAYLHQSRAIDLLLAEDARPTVVTTGTGSGKTECFLLPILQNAIDDAVRFKRSGITAIIVYPMNALANDQLERIEDYLQSSGHGYVSVARYDRSTMESERQHLRQRPPQILLTNYMMLEYLLTRPADRDDLFANHRCRYVVLDEVHTYRGTLGANIALLFRRLRAHLARARQEWRADDLADRRRFPQLVPIATSATIKSIDETEHSEDELEARRAAAVRGFLGTLTGVPGERFEVLGEALAPLEVPAEAAWPTPVPAVAVPDPRDPAAVAATVAALAGLPADTPMADSARHAAILWHLADALARKPMSLEQVVDELIATVPARQHEEPVTVRAEVEAAIVAGAALPAEVAGALRLRTHRFLRGGWSVHRCVDPACGTLYPRGEETCAVCGLSTAPLYLCRSCGADALRFTGAEDPEHAALVPYARGNEGVEWLSYERARMEAAAGDEDASDGRGPRVTQMKERPVAEGHFDPSGGWFARSGPGHEVVLAPARNRCLVCDATAGPGSVLTPVSLGTSAAVRVVAEGIVDSLAEANRDKRGHDGKERLLIFADSRQDAAHQARFITHAGRFDRMRRRLVRALKEASGSLSIEAAVTALLPRERESAGENPHTATCGDLEFMPKPVRERAKAWEEAPLLDDLAVRAGYRATVFNLGLVGVRYGELTAYIRARGEPLAAQLGLTSAQLWHLCRCILDDMRRRQAVSRELLGYHPSNPHAPDILWAADWSRQFATPTGFACTDDGRPVGYLDASSVVPGVRLYNSWRRPKGGGRDPGLQRLSKHLLARMGGKVPEQDDLEAVLSFLAAPDILVANRLHGYKKSSVLLQVSADAIQLALVGEGEQRTCRVCSVVMPWAEVGAPCPSCHGSLEVWPDAELRASRHVKRILEPGRNPLVAGEHTAQITGRDRQALEDDFKGSSSKINVLACSPTLEMGIDVGGLDAVLMRNVPPRPDNYAQRGGRAGRRSRVGVVLSYARNRPHDAYFFDKPREMIAGEVPAPAVALGNRDVVTRHLYAIAFGLAEPGLHGRMVEYVTPSGELNTDNVDALVAGLEAVFDRTIEIALDAWGTDVLAPLELDTAEALRRALEQLPERIRNLLSRVQYQVQQLQQTIDQWAADHKGDRRAMNAADLKRRILGLPSERKRARGEADDRTGGHPMRRFAEFGILPGYEFPTEPATVRLLRDEHEDEPIAVERRFGLAQYQPEANVHARGARWRVAGLDTSSPWNQRSDEPQWVYTICGRCELRYGTQESGVCPRCAEPAGVEMPLPCFEYGGFLAVRDDKPVLEEEDRFALASRLRCLPQWRGDLVAAYTAPGQRRLELRREEPVRWVNEGPMPSRAEIERGAPILTDTSRGFYLCGECGHTLKYDDPAETKSGGRRRAKKGAGNDLYGHTAQCGRRGTPPTAIAIGTETKATTLRLLVELPAKLDSDDYLRWGWSLGYALRAGARHLYTLDGPEIECQLEDPWEIDYKGRSRRRGALTFIDGAVGGSGFLDRMGGELHLVARRALEHLDHEECETACYRCLKTYTNQRFHRHLSWTSVVPDLEELATEMPSLLPADKRDVFDPQPWLDAYDAGVGSPLELAFLRLFQEHGLPVEMQVPVAPAPHGRPISIADFVVMGSRVAIYVDGAAFHAGANLRRDRHIRGQLRTGTTGWTVIELRAADLRRGAGVVAEIRRGAESHV